MSHAKKAIDERVTIRPVIDPEDESFLQELYSSTRDDLRYLSADENQARQLMTMQYLAQKRSYGQQFPNASHEIILLDGKAIGRMIVDRTSDAICLVDLAVLTDERGLGIGTIILDRLIEESSSRNVPIELSVLKTNRAQRLYDRLGFKIYDDDGVRLHMRRSTDESN